MIVSWLARFGAPALMVCALAHAQHVTDTKAAPDGHSGIRFTVEFGGPPTGSMGPILTNMPYSLRNVRQRIFANGVREPEEVLSSMYRDSLGRRRLDSFQFAGQYSTEGLRIVEIRDWVAQYEYTLDTANHIAYRMKLPRTLARPWQPQAEATPSVRQNVEKSQLVKTLGQQTIEGFLARGTLTVTVSRDSRNGATIQLFSQEVWTSTDLEPAARIVNRDASGLQTIQSIASVSHDEPAADLFMIPSDYEIRDVDGPYSIVVTVPENSLPAEIRQQVLKNSQAVASSFGVATATFPVAEAAGKTVRFSGWIRTENVTGGYAGLWWRVDGANPQVLAFDNSQARIIGGTPENSPGMRGAQGTTPWTRYQFELPVPADATNINFGTLLTGKGTAWFDALQVDLNGVTYRDSQFDFDFESPQPGPSKIKGFGYIGASSNSTRYKVALDTDQAYSGRQSLKMEFLGGPVTPATGDYSRPAKTIGAPLAALDPVLTENSYRAMDYATPAPINFVNRSKGPVDIYWLDYGGKRVLYKSALPSGTSWTAGSFVTHPWLVVATGTGGTTKNNTGEPLAAFTISPAAGGDAIIEDRN